MITRSPIGRVLALVSAFVGVGCGPATLPRGPYSIVEPESRRRLPEPEVGQAEWTLSRERLARVRRGLPRRPYASRVQVGVVDPRSKKLFRARGALAVSPDHAARLVLLGPGGTTALDVWVTREAFRFVIPSLELSRRGGTDLADAQGLPVGLLRWWFLSPFGGDLLLARSNERETVFVLKDRAATVTIQTDGEHFVATRREGGRLEGLEWLGRGSAPRAGDRGIYVDEEWGLRVYVLVEDVLDVEPDPAAFFDPDEEDATL